MIFSGSYRHDDVEFLLKRLSSQTFTGVSEKERLIQSSEKHYSEMLSMESLPSAQYMNLFQTACDNNREQMAGDCLALAALIDRRRFGPITLVSLVRAGTPVGVILKHILHKVMHRDVSHYSVSIIRDRGIDEVALRHILVEKGHSPESIVFVDGWTGKGVISQVLDEAVTSFNYKHRTCIDKGLYVLSDLAGTAACAASSADYLIPSSILNATVSGLVSRSVLNSQIDKNDFHGCVYYHAFEKQDQSREFAYDMVTTGLKLFHKNGIPDGRPVNKKEVAKVSRDFLQATLSRYKMTDVNLIKPGIGEATRVLLRRVPRLLILKDPEVRDVAHLKALATEKGVEIVIDKTQPYQAVSLIGSALDG